jgi:uncharacterized hydrophobic protein (TIGR00271 family)
MSILAVIDDEKEANALVRWSFQFARAKQCPLIIVRTQESESENEVTEINPEEEAKDHLVKIINETLESEKKQAEDISGTPHYDYHSEEEISTSMLKTPEASIKILKGNSLAGGILKMVSQHKPQLLIIGRHQSMKGQRHYTDKVFKRAHCSTLIIRLGDADFKRCSSMLIPCSGGPHCLEALKDSATLSEAQGTVVTPLIIEPDTGEMMNEVGKHILQGLLKRCSIKESSFIKPRVAINDDIEEGISGVAAEGFDLVIVGVSEMGNLRKKLFGTLPEKIMNKSSKLSIGVYRKRQSNLRVFLDKVEYWCNLAVPQLNRNERVALYENLYMNSTWNFDFVALMCLSTAIASLGLISNSAAVVIGAMLVAPLMVPILGAGLALVQGNIPLILNSAKSISFGFLAALGIGFACGILTPMDDATSEVLSRGSPRLADMFIAFLSGVAAAHCMSRPKLSAALPGVAIAAALVPPIASTGIALSLGLPETAMGAAILFLTNVICIILGSAITFFAAGIRSKNMKESKAWVQQSIIGLILCLSLLLVPLSSALIGKITKAMQKNNTEEVFVFNFDKIATATLPLMEKFGIISLTDNAYKPKINVWTFDVDASEMPEKGLVEELEKFIKSKLGHDVKDCHTVFLWMQICRRCFS